jgi:hypothetical protein
MRLLQVIVLFLLVLVACTKEYETDSPLQPPGEPVSPISVDDVVGSYLTIDYRSHWWQLPPPGGYNSHIDTAIMVINSDTVPPIEQSILYIGTLIFWLNEDSTIVPQSCGQQPGRFYMSNDTLRFEWECWTNGDFGDGSHRTLVGHRL